MSHLHSQIRAAIGNLVDKGTAQLAAPLPAGLPAPVDAQSAANISTVTQVINQEVADYTDLLVKVRDALKASIDAGAALLSVKTPETDSQIATALAITDAITKLSELMGPEQLAQALAAFLSATKEPAPVVPVPVPVPAPTPAPVTPPVATVPTVPAPTPVVPTPIPVTPAPAPVTPPTNTTPLPPITPPPVVTPVPVTPPVAEVPPVVPAIPAVPPIPGVPAVNDAPTAALPLGQENNLAPAP